MRTSIYLEDFNVLRPYLKIFQKFSILVTSLSPPANPKPHKVSCFSHQWGKSLLKTKKNPAS